ncbi:MAG: serpin family protein [Planctomycetes bacterium]|nr:serpin family protein [Planctomycetota bacterium]
MRYRTKLAVCMAVVALGAGVFFSSTRSKAQEEKRLAASEDARSLAVANNQFGFEMLKQLHKEGSNTFISPTSIGMALQMTSLGAKGDTLTQMNDTMHVGKLNVGKCNSELLSAFGLHNDLKLNLANSVWVNPNQITLNRDFADGVQKQFDAQIETREFNAETLNEINGWVADRTEQKIPKLLTDLSPDAAAVLINAVYFKGDWTQKFDKEKTKEADFTLSDGSTRKVQLMSSKSDYYYAETADAQWISLDYGKDKSMRMWVMLPKPDKSLDSLVKTLDSSNFKAATERCWEKEGTIKLPRLKMKFRKEIQDDLADMGMKKPFTAAADFSAFVGDEHSKLFISKVIHEAVIEVNEEGTEAAAATAVVMEKGAPARPFSMICDRPFLLAIEDVMSGSILFAGTVYDPGDGK